MKKRFIDSIGLDRHSHVQRVVRYATFSLTASVDNLVIRFGHVVSVFVYLSGHGMDLALASGRVGRASCGGICAFHQATKNGCHSPHLSLFSIRVFPGSVVAPLNFFGRREKNSFQFFSLA